MKKILIYMRSYPGHYDFHAHYFIYIHMAKVQNIELMPTARILQMLPFVLFELVVSNDNVVKSLVALSK